MSMAATARTRRWTPERRQQAAARIRARKPWLASTGPKTVTGKSMSRMNAYKHGARSATTIERNRELIRFVREQKECLRQIRLLLRLRRQIKKSSIMTNEVMKIHSRPSLSSRANHEVVTRDLGYIQNAQIPHRPQEDSVGMTSKEVNEVMRACRQLKSFVPKMLVFENRSAEKRRLQAKNL